MVKWIKNNLKNYPSVYKKISYYIHLKDNYWRPSKIKDIQEVLRIFSMRVKDISFIQIGSNDGISGDPLHDNIIQGNWKGILIEPIPFLFEQLVNNYSGFENKIQFKNCAVGKFTGTINLYTIDEEKRDHLPAWYFQLASFNKSVLHRHGIPNVESLIKPTTVYVDTFDKIMKDSNLQNLNLIHIDTEGYDYEILKTINYLVFHPEIIIFEYCHLNITEYKNALKLLKNYNYKLFSNDKDAIAIRYDFYRAEIKRGI